MRINLDKVHYGFNDIWIQPAVVSNISHRSECNPYNKDNMLPLFTAPMNSVINEKNYSIFNENKINTIIPRGVHIDIRMSLITKTFIALGLDEFERFIQAKESYPREQSIYICVDIANGHMKRLLDLCIAAKKIYGGQLLLMTGNIANPETYLEYAKAGIDFCRCSVGSGSCCITACNTGCYMSPASLIMEVVANKQKILTDIEYCKHNHYLSEYRSVPYIVADGGFDRFDKIIKALAIGADYVMIGQLFAQATEACGEAQSDDNGVFYRDYYGMSTKRAQAETGNIDLKTSEGIEKIVPVLYSLSGWCDNFISYLRSAMSYTNSKTLNEFKNSELILNSTSEFKEFYK